MTASKLQNLDLNLSDLEQIRLNFKKELQNASQDLPSSLIFFPADIRARVSLDLGQTFQIITIGGTNISSALAQWTQAGLKIIQQTKFPLPVLSSVEILLELIEQTLESGISHVSLNFAYPLKPLIRDGRLDGKLTHGVKEHKLLGLVGKSVGQTCEQFFQEKGIGVIFSVANDMLCLALTKDYFEVEPANFAVGVVGTGQNLAIYADEDNVAVLESANFDKFKLSWAAQKIDQVSQNLSQHLFEKEVSGKYLFQHYNLMCEVMNLSTIQDSEDLNLIAANSEHPGSNLAKTILSRSAALVAAQLAGLFDYLNQPVLKLVIEGSLFWSGFQYYELVREYLQQMKLSDRQIQFLKLPNSTIIGAGYLYPPNSDRL